MSIFSIFKKRKRELVDMEPGAMLSLIQEYIPDFYRTGKYFEQSKFYLEHKEPGLALENLIEMAVESGHYFSETFWENMAICATKMGMHGRADYCRKQITRNELELKSKTPYGWATVKLDDTHHQHHIASIPWDEYKNEQRKKDGFDKLIKKNGFHIKWYGRCGTIYYVNEGRVLEIGFDMSAVPQYNILPEFDRIKTWAIPAGEKLEGKEKSEIRQQLLDWCKMKRIKTDMEVTRNYFLP